MIPSANNPPPTKHWYKISVDAVKAWTALLSVVVLAILGFWGYRLLEERLLERQVALALEEGRELEARVRNEEDLFTYLEEFEKARQSLQEAETRLAAGELRPALRSAERGRTLLTSIFNSLRHRSAAGEAQFIAVQGEVEFRRGERGKWRPARSRVALQAGDYVKTSSGASAEIMAVDGTVYTVRADTVILVDKVSSLGGGLSERRIALEYGWVNLSTSRNTGTVTTPDAEARVGRESQAVVAYDEARRVGRFAAYQGSLQVSSRDGTTREINALEQVVQTAARLSRPQSLPGAPRPVEPADNLEVSMQEADRLVLRWEPVAGASGYVLQVSRSQLFTENIIEDQNRRKTLATLGLRGEGSFVWRVAALGKEGMMGPWSRPRKFRVTAS